MTKLPEEPSPAKAHANSPAKTSSENSSEPSLQKRLPRQRPQVKGSSLYRLPKAQQVLKAISEFVLGARVLDAKSNKEGVVKVNKGRWLHILLSGTAETVARRKSQLSLLKVPQYKTKCMERSS